MSYLTPAVRLAAVVALVWLCLSGAWRWQTEPDAFPRRAWRADYRVLRPGIP